MKPSIYSIMLKKEGDNTIAYVLFADNSMDILESKMSSKDMLKKIAKMNELSSTFSSPFRLVAEKGNTQDYELKPNIWLYEKWSVWVHLFLAISAFIALILIKCLFF